MFAFGLAQGAAGVGGRAAGDGTQRVRRMAHKTGCANRRVPRLQQAMARRGCHPASWGWATADGRGWEPRVGVAPRSPCGLQRGVGWETRRACCGRLRLAPQGGCAPAACRGGMPAWAAARLEPAAAWEPDGWARGERRARMGAVEATGLDRLRVGLLDRATGSRLRAEGADARPSPAWQAWGAARRKALGTGGVSVGRARAQALRPRADPGPALAALGDCWWHGGHRDGAPCLLASRWRQGGPRAACPGSMGMPRGGAPVVAAAPPRGPPHGPPCQRPVTGPPARRGWLPPSWRRGTPGRSTGAKPCSAPRRRSQAATAGGRPCLPTLGACPSNAPRGGPCGLPALVALRMIQRRPRGFVGGDSRTALPRCEPRAGTGHDLGNASRAWRAVVESVWCPALRGYP
jgi:hypothetical protein